MIYLFVKYGLEKCICCFLLGFNEHLSQQQQDEQDSVKNNLFSSYEYNDRNIAIICGTTGNSDLILQRFK